MCDTVAITLRACCAAGGDPTGTGTGGESIYGRPFKDEIHSRLRFTHRGLVACANRNEPHTNGSQFFITLDATPQLDRKYTIFGRVAGGDTGWSVVWERIFGRAVLLIIVNVESAHVDPHHHHHHHPQATRCTTFCASTTWRSTPTTGRRTR